MKRSHPAKRKVPTQPLFLPRKIISGGQTGVDRAGLDVAIALGIEHGGWCPKGRMSEDGTIPSRYELVEIDVRDYRVRTEKNVVESDATLILYQHSIRRGTALTRRYCIEHDKRMLAVNLVNGSAELVAQWLVDFQPNTLNVAGPRESSHPGIHMLAMELMLQVFA